MPGSLRLAASRLGHQFTSELRQEIVGDLFFGEREAVRIAFNLSGTVFQEQSLPSTAAPFLVGGSPSVRTLGELPALTVPNTLLEGLNFGKEFAVAAVAVVGQIGVADESDFYSFQGRKGDLINLDAKTAVRALRLLNTSASSEPEAR